MSTPAPNCLPRLAPGCRLSTAAGQENMLLIPEGALRLKGTARTIVELCNGERVFVEIIEVLKQRYPSADAQRIETEVVALLAHLRERGAIEYV